MEIIQILGYIICGIGFVLNQGAWLLAAAELFNDDPKLSIILLLMFIFPFFFVANLKAMFTKPYFKFYWGGVIISGIGALIAMIGTK